MAFDQVLLIFLTALCTGLGNAIGQYFAQRGLIKKLERLEHELIRKREANADKNVR